jgi:hypothetical protein
VRGNVFAKASLVLVFGYLLTESVSANDPIDLSCWNLTLPTGAPAKPDVIATSKLLSGYKSDYFYRTPDGGLVFWCPVSGVTTKGTHYPRTELRETDKNGKKYNWHSSQGRSVLSGELAVTQVPGTGRLTVGQIHDDGTGGIKSEPLLKLVYKYKTRTKTGDLVAEVRPAPEAPGNNYYVLITGVKLGDRFSYRIELKPDLTLKVDINGKEAYSAMVDRTWAGQELYFKAGSYLEDNSGSADDGGRVVFYSLALEHLT